MEQNRELRTSLIQMRVINFFILSKKEKPIQRENLAFSINGFKASDT